MTDHLESRRALMRQAADYLESLSPADGRAALAKTGMHSHVKEDPAGLARRLRATANDPEASTFASWKAAQWVMIAKEGSV